LLRNSINVSIAASRIHALDSNMNPATPPTTEIFTRRELVERHPHILKNESVLWGLRNRDTNGLKASVFETRSGQLLIHEPGFLAWYLGLTGRAKPRAARRKRRAFA
jgi:hypothetical protein